MLACPPSFVATGPAEGRQPRAQRPRNAARVPADLPEVAGGRVGEAEEVKARRLGGRRRAVHPRKSVRVEQPETAEERLEPAPEPRGRDHHLGLDPPPPRSSTAAPSKPSTAGTTSMRPARSAATKPTSRMGICRSRTICV